MKRHYCYRKPLLHNLPAPRRRRRRRKQMRRSDPLRNVQKLRMVRVQLHNQACTERAYMLAFLRLGSSSV